MAKILKNQTGSPVPVTDRGETVPASGQLVIAPLDYPDWEGSSDVIVLIADGTLVLNDGSNDITIISDAIDIIKGFQKGPAGSIGPTGSQGIQGIQGTQGTPGIDGNNIEIKDEGSSKTTTPTSIDFVGAGVTATNIGDDVTVTIAGGGGSGDVVGPGSATDEAVARYDGTTGKLIQDSSMRINDSGRVGVNTSPKTDIEFFVQGSYGGNVYSYSVGATTNYNDVYSSGSNLDFHTASQNFSITGITGGEEGEYMSISNRSTYDMTLKHQDAGSSTTNRFYLPENVDYVIKPGGGITLQYTNNYRWHTISVPSAAITQYTHPNHTGEVTSTGDGATVVANTSISNKTQVTAAATDTILIGDASDSNNLKKVTAQSIADLGSGGGPPSQSSISAIPVTTRTSATYGQMFQMLITPAAGNYRVYFNGSATNSDGTSTTTIAIFVGGTIVSNTVRQLTLHDSRMADTVIPMATTGYVSVNGSELVEIRWKEDGGGTASMYERTLVIMEVS